MPMYRPSQNRLDMTQAETVFLGTRKLCFALTGLIRCSFKYRSCSSTLGCVAACTASTAFCACCLRKVSRAAPRWLDIISGL